MAPTNNEDFIGIKEHPIAKSDLEIVQNLWENEVCMFNPDILLQHKTLALLACIVNKKIKLVKLLLNNGVNGKVKYMSDKVLPIVEAMKTGHLGIVKLLIQHGATVHVRTQSQQNLLHIAVVHIDDQEELSQAVEFLTQEGIDLFERDSDNLTVWDAAFRAKKTKACVVLGKYNVLKNTSLEELESIFTTAIENNMKELVEFFLTSDTPQLNFLNNETLQSLIDLAITNDLIEIAILLADQLTDCVTREGALLRLFKNDSTESFGKILNRKIGVNNYFLLLIDSGPERSLSIPKVGRKLNESDHLELQKILEDIKRYY